jgi:iron(III) transport system substrate-binding protein
MTRKLTRRRVLAGSATALAASGWVRSAQAAPPAEKITPDLIAAAKKEGKVTWYTSVDLALGEKVAKLFEAKYPGVSMKVERSGAERNFQRIGQEYASKIYNCDVVNSSDASHFIIWKRQQLLAPYVPEDVAQYFPDAHKDPDGMFASWRVTLSPLGYNTKLVKAEDAPKSFKDLLDPKWKSKIVKAHPGYSGTILTATFEMVRDIGWDFYENLAKQNIMQVQSSADPPKRLELGERAVMADGNEYNIFQMKEAGRPVEPVYASEGTPLIIGPNGIFKGSPHPNAAKLFQSFCFSREAQQLIIDIGGLRSAHPQTEEKAGWTPLKDIKTLKEDAVAVEQQSSAIKSRYTRIFRV